MIGKVKRKSDVKDYETPRRHSIGKRMESSEIRTPIILSSRTKSIEKPAPKSNYENNAVKNEHTGVGRVIKYLHARDACMQNDVSKVMQTCELKKYAAISDGCGKLIKLFFRGFTYFVFILFILLSILSLNTLIENKYSKLVEISELITSVTIPSVEDIYYFSKESKESVKEAFNYLSRNKLGSVKEKKKAEKRKNQQISVLSKNQRDYSKLGFQNSSSFNLDHATLSVEQHHSINNPNENYETPWRKELIENSKNSSNYKSGIQGKKQVKNYSRNYNQQQETSNQINNQFHLTKLVEIILDQNLLENYLDGENLSILELLCYKNFSFQEGILGMYYREKDEPLSFQKYFGEFEKKKNSELINKLENKRIFDLLGFEKQYELYISSNNNYFMNSIKNQTHLGNIFRVSRKVIVSSGYGNEEIRDFCQLKNNWICTKYEMLVFKLLLEYYKGTGDTFISFFLWQYKRKIVEKNLLDNIPFFTKNQIMVVNHLFPGLFESFQNLTNSIYNKIDEFEKRRKYNKSNQSRYYFENITEEEINWIISLVLSHSLQDKDGNIAFVPYFNIIPHNSQKFSDCEKGQTILHHPNELSFDWKFSQNLTHRCNHNHSNHLKKDYTMIHSFYGHLNNIKSVVQYGKLLDNNEYSTVWFIRKDKKDINGFKILFGTSNILNSMDSQAYRDYLPTWLLDLSETNNSKIRVNMENQFVHYISKTKKIPIIKNKHESKLKYIDCNEYIFYNGVGLGFGTVQFLKSSSVGGINGSVYVCLREIIFRNYPEKKEKLKTFTSSNINTLASIPMEKKEEILANIMHSNCGKRYTQLEDVKNLLIHQLNQKLPKELKEEDFNKFPSQTKQEIRINIKLLYSTIEELKTMKECVSYFERLIQIISRNRSV
ncbi:uncharacterized protein cubi_03418 [Cryptosporidium ubiquitum]|uniref:Uncharacterized protein n=1 Tax=Cryptosporidium ubiquitum TaxID=857276 RepID=A0A1J4MKR7_9CRYT|nr:uncharacterized protein cubi_03418 [Cryptosporidium ubiquitum]OII73620.1 hypothetical protein cubi_03418 [Cryptosporidium ubiquitum]